VDQDSRRFGLAADDMCCHACSDAANGHFLRLRFERA
jgi:hypothetical protein